MKLKKAIVIPVVIILCVIVYALAAPPMIASGTWMLSYAMQMEPCYIVAHNPGNEWTEQNDPQFQLSKPIDLVLEAADGKLQLTDKTNGVTYEGTYHATSLNTFVKQKYDLVIDGIEGTASVSLAEGRTFLYINLPEHTLCFLMHEN